MEGRRRQALTNVWRAKMLAMKFKVAVEIDVEVDVTDLRVRALDIIARGGGIQTTDGTTPELGVELNIVDDPTAAMLMVWRQASLMAFQQELPEGAEIHRWSPTVVPHA